MRRRMLLFLAVLALASSSAMAVTLTMIAPLAGSTTLNSEARAITPDGSYVVGISGAGATYPGFLWDVTNGSRAVVGTGWGASQATGVGYRMVGGSQQLVISGLSGGYETIWTNDLVSPTTFGQFYRNTGAGIAQGGYNTLASNGTDDTFYFNWKNLSTSLKTNVAKGSGTGTVAVDTYTGTAGQMATDGVSAAGLSVGYRKDSLNAYRQSQYHQWTGTGSGTPGLITGLDGTKKWEAYAVAGDNVTGKVFGDCYTTTDQVNLRPYMFSFMTGLTTALPMFGDETGSTTLGVPYGASPDGRYVSGMLFRGVEKAVLWDTQLGTVIDLTAFASAHGGLGGFTTLSRGYSVGVDTNGNPVVAGKGDYVENGTTYTRGFVLTVPEPSTLLFLGLGAAGVLRRRR